MKMVNIDLLFADRKKLVIVAVCLFAVFYADMALVIGWQMRSIADAKKKIAKVNVDVANLSRDMSLMSQAATTTINIHGENSIPDILRYISALAAEHSIKLVQITPVKSKEIRKMQSASYLGLVIKLDLNGGYHNFGAFLNKLGEGEQPLFASDVHISQGTDFMRQQISLSLKTYVKK
jgi:hypothetical protein